VKFMRPAVGRKAASRRSVLIGLIALSCWIFQGWAYAQKAITPEQETFTNLELTLPPPGSKERFYQLSRVASAAYDAGDYEKADAYANELLSEADRNSGNWYYGDAIFYGNTTLGLVALKRDNNISQADNYLLAAGKTPGGPDLNSFGPNMLLAQELLKAGERDVVLDFIGECGRFWKGDPGRLSKWKEEIDKGEMPDFAPNLKYR
jgi:hypothetical protein